MQFDGSAYFLFEFQTYLLVFVGICCHLNLIGILVGRIDPSMVMFTNSAHVHAAAHKETRHRNHWRCICKSHIWLNDVSCIPAQNAVRTEWQNETVCRQPCRCIVVSNHKRIYWGCKWNNIHGLFAMHITSN